MFMRSLLRIACCLAIGLMLAMPGSVMADAHAASVPANASSVLPLAFLGIGGENEPDENDNEPGGGPPPRPATPKSAGLPAPFLLLLGAVGLAGVAYRVKLSRRARARARRFARSLPRARR